jgi:hypothetical protein
MKITRFWSFVAGVAVVAVAVGPASSAAAAPSQQGPAKKVLISQWASSAKATSQYSSPLWAARQATHAPNTEGCGDRPTAWASKDKAGIDTLTVGFKIPVVPQIVKVYQTYNPGQVTKVQVVDVKGKAHNVYAAAPVALVPPPPCPVVLEVPITGITTKVQTVRITVDQSVLGIYQDEIDAVQLVGMGSR